jgi:hypothetical protein
MPLMPHVDAVLVFDASQAEATGEYAIYAIAPDEQTRFHGRLEAVRETRKPTGHVPVSDVEFDDDGKEIRVLTMGIERFATVA